MPHPKSLDHLLAQVGRLHQSRGHKVFNDLGLYRGQPPLLLLLWEQEGRTHSELATKLHVAPATISKMIQRMEKSGMVERRPDPDDQRVSRVYLTQAGRDVHERVETLLQRFDEETFAALTKAEKDVLFDLLMRVRDTLVQLQSSNVKSG